MGSPRTLQDVLADARENLSRARKSALRHAFTDKHSEQMAQKGYSAPIVLSKADIPNSGKNTPRIVAGMSTAFLYYLADPRAPRAPRYVGLTTNVASREKKHGTLAGHYGLLKAWKLTLRAAGVKPRLVVLAEYPTWEAGREVEWRLIWRWKRRGLCEFNTECGSWQRYCLMCAGQKARQAIA